jgi:SAM-dependent methyltransferase
MVPLSLNVFGRHGIFFEVFMNEREAYARLAKIAGMDEGLVPLLAELFIDQTVINPCRDTTIRQLGKVLGLKPGLRVLDLGCGKAGVTLPMVHVYKVRLVGVDLMPEFIREAWARAEHTGLYEGCEFILDDAREFVARTRSQWDVIIINGALPYLWPTMEEGMNALQPILKPGGKLVIGLPYAWPGGEQDPEEPQMSLDETTAFFGKWGSVEIMDDGRDGWEAYIAPQKQSMARLKDAYPDLPGMMALQGLTDRLDWEKANWGFALWIVTKNQ